MDAEQENTFRALREQELLVTSFWCKFGFHTWTKYREPTLVREGYNQVLIQERRCASCNIFNRKKLPKRD